MIDKINKEIVSSMKSKDKFRLMTLRMMKSQLEEESKKSKGKREDVEVITAYAKKLEKSIKIKNIPQDFIDKTKKELDIIKDFLPPEMTIEEITALCKDIISKEPTTAKNAVVQKTKVAIKDSGKICRGDILFKVITKLLSGDK